MPRSENAIETIGFFDTSQVSVDCFTRRTTVPSACPAPMIPFVIGWNARHFGFARPMLAAEMMVGFAPKDGMPVPFKASKIFAVCPNA